MGEVEIRIALPADVAALLGETTEAATGAARRAVILHLLREGAVSQSEAAEILGVTRHDILDLMAKYNIPSGPQTIEELLHEVEVADRVLSAQADQRRRS
jgi:predicted HTH domain antitoxin